MNLLAIENQIRAYEGTQEEADPLVRTVIRNQINECYMELALYQPWSWLMKETTITAADGDVRLTLPTDTGYLMWMKHPDGTLMEPRDEKRQIEYYDELNAASDMYTYAMDDLNTGTLRVRLVPAASAGDYEIRYSAIPVELDDDTDSPLTPLGISQRLVSAYLIWRVTSLRLLTDHERRDLIGVTEGRAAQMLNLLQRLEGRNPVDLKTRVVPRK